MISPSERATLVALRSFTRLAIAGVLIAICLANIPSYLLELKLIPLLKERDHGDSYILYDIQHFEKTGIIYRDLTQPPYLPAQYSPFVYLLYSVPGFLIQEDNPFIGPRLLVLAAFLGCVGVMVSITRTLLPIRFAWMWGILAAGSIASMSNWVLQIRGDFPGILFSLLSIRMLLSRSRWSPVLAGIAAGLATQFKFTFVAAGIAGTLWLLLQRRWKDLGKFIATAAVSSAGLYILYLAREHRMLAQIFSLRPGIRNITGDVELAILAFSEPLALVALAGLSRFAWRASSRWSLMLIFTTLSVAVASVTNLQAGGNVNYYFESLFSTIPFAVFGALRLVNLGRRSPALGVCFAGLMCTFFLIPRAQALRGQITETPLSVAEENHAFRKLEEVLSERHILSTVPRLALLDPAPPLMEPYLMSYLHRLGKVDTALITRPVRDEQYELVATAEVAVSWRGIPFIDPDLHEAIASSYRPYCTIEGWLMHLPIKSDSRKDELMETLAGIGCKPVSPSGPLNW
jgi:hypothetical protein